MQNIELRNLEEARRYLLQGLWWQRVIPPRAENVRTSLEWYLEMASGGQALPPIGFVADVGQAAFSSDWELRGSRTSQAQFFLPVNLVSTYEDHVLGKVYGDWTFARASDALRQYQGRDRARGLAYLMEHFKERARYPGVEFSPGIIKNALEAPPEEVLNEGWKYLREEGPLPLLVDLYQELINSARRTAEILGPDDLFEIEHKTALEDLGNSVARRQVIRTAASMMADVGQFKLSPRPGRPEVPTRILDEDAYPVGGYTSISTRGSVESLLHSQLAYIEPDPNERPDLFDIKFLRDELFYYSRDENQFLRHRRTFVIALHSDLVETRFKDPDLPYQRGILLMGLIVGLIQKLTEWLNTDDLHFRILFLGDPDKGLVLEDEFDLLQTLLREYLANKTVTLEQMPTEVLASTCANWARTRMVHCLNVSTAPILFDAQDTVVTLLRVDKPRPALGDVYSQLETPDTEDAVDAWNKALKNIISRWI